jgi:PKD repeat protein
MDWLNQHGLGPFYDFNNNSRLDFNDVVTLFDRL